MLFIWATRSRSRENTPVTIVITANTPESRSLIESIRHNKLFRSRACRNGGGSARAARSRRTPGLAPGYSNRFPRALRANGGSNVAAPCDVQDATPPMSRRATSTRSSTAGQAVHALGTGASRCQARIAYTVTVNTAILFNPGSSRHGS